MADGRRGVSRQRRSEVSHLPVPGTGEPKTLIELYARFVAQLSFGAGDVECTILPVPVDAAREDRRRDAERFADLLAEVTREPAAATPDSAGS